MIGPPRMLGPDAGAVLEKALDGRRLEVEEGLSLLQAADLAELAAAAGEVARRRHPDRTVTFVVDRNINYTNICVTRCRFCAFHRSAGDPDAYVLPLEEILAKVEEAVALGATQLLIQGGHHPTLKFDYYLEMCRRIRDRFPQVDVHSFSPSEVLHFSRTYRLPVRRVLEELRGAGLASLPGGGAEILDDRVRGAVSPAKNTWSEWMGVMEAAADLGLKATATMMFGHVETLEERILHLERIRQVQDRKGVFRAFIPWTYQPGNTRLGGTAASAFDYLRTVAVSRLYLDNVENLQASWVTQGGKVAQLSLDCGCNDFGGTMLEENVVRSAGVSFRLSQAEVIALIRGAGRQPAKRNTRYEILERYD